MSVESRINNHSQSGLKSTLSNTDSTALIRNPAYLCQISQNTYQLTIVEKVGVSRHCIIRYQMSPNSDPIAHPHHT